MNAVTNRQKLFWLPVLVLSGLLFFSACSGADFSGYYGAISKEGIVLSIELKQDGSMQTNVFGLPLTGTYTVEGEKLTLTYEYLGMKDSVSGRISKDAIEFADITLERDFSPSSNMMDFSGLFQ